MSCMLIYFVVHKHPTFGLAWPSSYLFVFNFYFYYYFVFFFSFLFSFFIFEFWIFYNFSWIIAIGNAVTPRTNWLSSDGINDVNCDTPISTTPPLVHNAQPYGAINTSLFSILGNKLDTRLKFYFRKYFSTFCIFVIIF